MLENSTTRAFDKGSRLTVARADDATLIPLPRTAHFEAIDPHSADFGTVLDVVLSILEPRMPMLDSNRWVAR